MYTTLASGAYFQLEPEWIAQGEARTLFEELRAELPWVQKTIRMFGKDILEPRLTVWLGDAEAVYAYSGVVNVPFPMTPALGALRDRLQLMLDVRFNGVLANLYRDGADSMGWHSDDEPELGANPIIASVSLGAERLFRLAHKKDKADRVDLRLPHGSLLVMGGTIQTHYRHSVPKTKSAVGERINLTFRRIIGSEASIRT
ncbi:MAG: alpha-ketoglutarate-dependent dioxygenase AlkB [Deltaproteobacteria bacterium]|nr:alpha-ketoglutarate-dependent dioxygenase AlkB [Deltaproteobacteria bacterium]